MSDSLVASLDDLALSDDSLLAVTGLSLVDLHHNLLVSLEFLLESSLLVRALAMSDLSSDSTDLSVNDFLLSSSGLVESMSTSLLVSLVDDQLLLNSESLGTLAVLSLLSESSDLLSDEFTVSLVLFSFSSD